MNENISSKENACLNWIKIVLKCVWLVFKDKKDKYKNDKYVLDKEIKK